jgi:hypothetical protein
VRRLSSIGDELWRAPVPVSIFGGGIEVDHAGDVVVHGWDGTGARYPIRDMIVAKLDGATSATRWTHLAQEVGSSSAKQVAFDPQGDVIVAGMIHDETVACPSFAVLKLSGLDGTEQWRRVIPGPIACGGQAEHVVVDLWGDVTAAGSVLRADGGINVFAVKVDGDDGSEHWRYHVQNIQNAGGGDTHGLTLTPDGDALISARVRLNASIGDSLRVVRLRGSDGSAVWARDLRGTHQTADNGQAYPAESLVAVGPNGEIFVGDALTNLDTGPDLAVVRLDGETGAEDWRFTWDGGGGGHETARGVAIDARGDLFVIGYTQTVAYGRGFSVFKLDGGTGSPWPCADGFDQDGDELVDYPSDPECASLEDPSENADCSDGVDNDSDGLVDFGFDASNDPGCAAPEPWAIESPQCSNGLDDDLDGLIDHGEDASCAAPWFASETRTRRACGLLGLELLIPLVAMALRRPRTGAHPASA